MTTRGDLTPEHGDGSANEQAIENDHKSPCNGKAERYVGSDPIWVEGEDTRDGKAQAALDKPQPNTVGVLHAIGQLAESASESEPG